MKKNHPFNTVLFLACLSVFAQNLFFSLHFLFFLFFHFRIYNIKSAKLKKTYKGSVSEDGVLIKLQLDPSGSYIVTSCTDKILSLFDFYTGELVASFYGHSEIATSIKFANDLKHLISVSGDG